MEEPLEQRLEQRARTRTQKLLLRLLRVWWRECMRYKRPAWMVMPPRYKPYEELRVALVAVQKTVADALVANLIVSKAGVVADDVQAWLTHRMLAEAETLLEYVHQDFACLANFIRNMFEGHRRPVWMSNMELLAALCVGLAGANQSLFDVKAADVLEALKLKNDFGHRALIQAWQVQIITKIFRTKLVPYWTAAAGPAEAAVGPAEPAAPAEPSAGFHTPPPSPSSSEASSTIDLQCLNPYETIEDLVPDGFAEYWGQH